MRARAEVTYVAGNPGAWEEMWGASADNAFIDFIHGEVEDIGGGVSAESVRVVKVDEEFRLGTFPGAPWHGLPVDQRPPLPNFPPLPEPGSAPGESVDNHDPVDHPKHYTSHPSGVEVIDLTEGMGFPLGNAVKYLQRAPYKGKHLEDLEKCAWYIRREMDRRARAVSG